MLYFSACWCRYLCNWTLGMDRKGHVLKHWQSYLCDPWPCPRLHHHRGSDVFYWVLRMHWCPQGKHMSAHVCKFLLTFPGRKKEKDKFDLLGNLFTWIGYMLGTCFLKVLRCCIELTVNNKGGSLVNPSWDWFFYDNKL